MDKLMELKSKAYDCLAIIERTQQALQQINREIQIETDKPKEEVK